MTRRKRQALAAVEPALDLTPAPLMDLPRTQGGNVFLELGDENLDAASMAQALEGFNSEQPTTTNQVDGITPVLYHEPSEATQNDTNFFSSVFDFSKYSTDAELAQEMHDFLTNGNDLWSMVRPDEQTSFVNDTNASDFDVDLERMSTS